MSSGIFEAVIGTLPTLRVVARTLARAARGRLMRIIRGDQTFRVGVDIRPFYEPLTGIGWYLFHILDELGGRDDVELILFGDARVTDDGPQVHATLPASCRYSIFDLRGIPTSRFSRPMTAGAYLALVWLENCDVIFGSNYFLPRLMDSVATRRVITIHDLTYRRYPELLQKETLENLEREMPRSIARADEIITVSEATKRDLLELYDVDDGRVHAILSGASLGDRREPVASRPALISGIDRYVLFVSTIEPRKNLEVLVDAFELAVEKGYAGHLVVVGRVGWKADATMRRMRASRHADRIHHLDYVDRDDLGALYAHADVYVMPSLYEGFGLPILEAMASGTAVIAADSSSLPEVGGDAARYFTPHDAAELGATIMSVVSDQVERDRLVEAGLARSGQFDWTATAVKTLAVFRRAAGRSR